MPDHITHTDLVSDLTGQHGFRFLEKNMGRKLKLSADPQPVVATRTRIRGIHGGDTRQVSKKKLAVKARKAAATVPVIVPKGFIPFSPENKPPPPKRGQTLLGRVREILKQPSPKCSVIDPERIRFDDAAEAFVQQMENGNFQFHKEFVDREEGKVTQKIDLGVTTKLYVGMPTEGEEAP